jgi:hypothetical protein
MPLSPTQQKKLQRLALALDGKEVGVLTVLEQVEKGLEAKIEGIERQIPALRQVEDGKQGAKGDKGDSIKGDKGDRGEKGKDGIGTKGKDGTNGRDGKDGVDGINGTDGVDGINGTNGVDGFVDEAVVAYLEDEIKRVDSKPTNFGKVIREIGAGDNVTIDESVPGRPVINVTSGGGAWGDITGTLSDQTDLQDALDGLLKGLVDDETPTLGGDLDTDGHDITSTSGQVRVVGDFNVKDSSDNNLFQTDKDGNLVGFYIGEDPRTNSNAGILFEVGRILMRNSGNFSCEIVQEGYDFVFKNGNSSNLSTIKAAAARIEDIRSAANYISATIGNGSVTVGNDYTNVNPFYIRVKTGTIAGNYVKSLQVVNSVDGLVAWIGDTGDASFEGNLGLGLGEDTDTLNRLHLKGTPAQNLVRIDQSDGTIVFNVDYDGNVTVDGAVVADGVTLTGDQDLSEFETTAQLDARAALKINATDLVDSLTSAATDKPLTAAQGQVLKGFIDNINTLIGSDETTLDTLQEIVDFIEINRASLENLTIASIAGLQNALNAKQATLESGVNIKTINGVSAMGTGNIATPDTTYSEMPEAEITAGTADTLRTITARRLKFLTDAVENSVAVTYQPTKTADTGTVISLSNFLGNVCNMGSANSTTTYTLTGTVDFGNAVVLINAATAPVVTGATNIKGSDFVANENMYLRVWNNGTRVEYWFEQIAI